MSPKYPVGKEKKKFVLYISFSHAEFTAKKEFMCVEYDDCICSTQRSQPVLSQKVWYPNLSFEQFVIQYVIMHFYDLVTRVTFLDSGSIFCAGL